MLTSLILRKYFTILPRYRRAKKEVERVWMIWGCVQSGKRVWDPRTEAGGLNHDACTAH